MIRVCLADDHTIVRDGLKQILAEEPDIEVRGEAHDGEQTLALMDQVDCDVLVLDISMPPPSGVELIRLLLGSHPGLSILILSMHSENQYAVRSIRAGARGYLAKTSAAEQLVSAIRRVSSGQIFLNANLNQKLALNMLTDDDSEPHRMLSKREYHVFTLLVGGRTVSQIADELEVSSKTVSTHKTRILQKMGMDSVAALVRYAMEHDLIESGMEGS
ncbi:DNA-binding NarL/FixJ family response regulator [Natronocella acetinitrilica]|uniref:DNA-binding NarL/FixJ family response regulator n=1 Tax=Natronocella acetinitrilica TaxID=414046 RepID=A0AAE3KGR7_9GAMM|nr:response regulator transcription factor [Natronocella acetinitrilica]MCP1675532.1 DNA-binding NarL/FixJ family response regulator [Natronocella acetinitrilica]